MILKRLSHNSFFVNRFRLFLNQLAASVGAPEKAGVGGSIPSLATMFSNTYWYSVPGFGSNWFQFWSADRCLVLSRQALTTVLESRASLPRIVRPRLGFGACMDLPVWVHENAKANAEVPVDLRPCCLSPPGNLSRRRLKSSIAVDGRTIRSVPWFGRDKPS